MLAFQSGVDGAERNGVPDGGPEKGEKGRGPAGRIGKYVGESRVVGMAGRQSGGAGLRLAPFQYDDLRIRGSSFSFSR